MSRHLDFLSALILLFWAATLTASTFVGGITTKPEWLWLSVPAGAFACWWAFFCLGARLLERPTPLAHRAGVGRWLIPRC